MITMNWFRLYGEFATDPKVQSMPEVMQRRLVMLFCLECSGDLETLDETELARALRIGAMELEETRRLFIRKGFIDEDWKLRNWEKRQAPADPKAAERMRLLRERRRREADELRERSANVAPVVRPNKRRSSPDVRRNGPRCSPNVTPQILDTQITEGKLPSSTGPCSDRSPPAHARDGRAREDRGDACVKRPGSVAQEYIIRLQSQQRIASSS
jgi:hypothetical protein